jgi:hypothetical protein
MLVYSKGSATATHDVSACTPLGIVYIIRLPFFAPLPFWPAECLPVTAPLPCLLLQAQCVKGLGPCCTDNNTFDKSSICRWVAHIAACTTSTHSINSDTLPEEQGLRLVP